MKGYAERQDRECALQPCLCKTVRRCHRVWCAEHLQRHTSCSHSTYLLLYSTRTEQTTEHRTEVLRWDLTRDTGVGYHFSRDHGARSTKHRHPHQRAGNGSTPTPFPACFSTGGRSYFMRAKEADLRDVMPDRMME